LREVTPNARTYCPYCQYPFPASGASPIKPGASRPEAVTDERFRAGRSIDDIWDVYKFVRREWSRRGAYGGQSAPNGYDWRRSGSDCPTAHAAWSSEASARGAGRLLWLVLGLGFVFVGGLVVFSVFGH